MRRVILAAALAGCAGTASADERLYGESRFYGSSDYAAQAFVQLNFGGERSVAPQPMLGFQVYNQRAEALGAPALLRGEFSGEGLRSFSMNGVNLTAVRAVSAIESGVFAGWTVGEVITVTAAILAVGIGTASALDDDEDEPAAPGTGTGGGG